MENTVANIIDEVSGELISKNAKLVVLEEKLYVYLPKQNFKEVQKILKSVGFVINGNNATNTITDVCYEVNILSKAIKHKFKLVSDVNSNVKVEFKKISENNAYYYFGQHSSFEVEKIMLSFIELNLIGFYDEEVCKMFERKYKKK